MLNMLRSLPLLAFALIVGGCGTNQASESQAQRQFALAATVAAAPTRSAPPATIPSVSPAAPTAQPTTQPTATALPTAAAAPASPTAQPTIIQPKAATALPTADVQSAASPIPPTARPPLTNAPSAIPALPATSAIAPAATDTPVPTAAPAPAPPTAIPAPPTAIPASPTVAPPPDDGRPVELSFTDLYSGASITGPVVSPLTESLNGHKVIMVGYMAPPLKPSLDFFVLTKVPMVYCPFCNTAADWPFDIIFVRMAGGQSVPPVVPSAGIRITGTLQVGVATDAQTGFVSMIRIIADDVADAK